MNKNISDNAEDLNQQISSTLELIRQLNGMANLLSLSVNAVESNISEQLNLYHNAITKLQHLNKTVVEKIGNASNISLTIINTLTDRFASGIQNLHTFDSCAAVIAFSIELPYGLYNIKSGDSMLLQQYCMSLCNGVKRRLEENSLSEHR